MQKEVSLQLKGIAILMMLFLHLFNQYDQVLLCYTSVNFWNGKPLVYALSRIGGLCVPIYLFLSGYGLSAVYEKSAVAMHIGRRLLKLYVNYWIVLLLFVALGSWIAPDRYPGDAVTLVLNLTAWWHTYNDEWWFLFPYVLLVVLFPAVYGFLRKRSARLCRGVMVGLTILYFMMYFADKRWGQCFDACYVLSQLRQFTYCLYSFVWGAVFYHYRFIERFRLYLVSRFSRGLGLACMCGGILLLLLRMMLGPSIVNPFFALAVLLIYNSFPPHVCRSVRRFLGFMGSHSTNLWLVHTFFAYYLFHDFIYGLKYPLVMYVVLIILSLLSSYLVRLVYRLLRMERHLRKLL